MNCLFFFIYAFGRAVSYSPFTFMGGVWLSLLCPMGYSLVQAANVKDGVSGYSSVG